jgi:hypothetical protein
MSGSLHPNNAWHHSSQRVIPFHANLSQLVKSGRNRLGFRAARRYAISLGLASERDPEFVTHHHLDCNHQGLDNRLVIVRDVVPALPATLRTRRQLGGTLVFSIARQHGSCV